MKKIPIKIEGLSAQELVEILSNNDFDKNITFEIEEAKDDERSWNDIVNLVADNIETFATFLGALFTFGNLYIKHQELKLSKKRLELDREKFEFEKEKLKKPKSIIIQQNIGDDIFLPFNFKNEKDFKNYLKQNSINLKLKNIKSIYFK